MAPDLSKEGQLVFKGVKIKKIKKKKANGHFLKSVPSIMGSGMGHSGRLCQASPTTYRGNQRRLHKKVGVWCIKCKIISIWIGKVEECSMTG